MKSRGATQYLHLFQPTPPSAIEKLAVVIINAKNAKNNKYKTFELIMSLVVLMPGRLFDLNIHHLYLQFNNFPHELKTPQTQIRIVLEKVFPDLSL